MLRRLDSLRTRHAILDAEIDQEHMRPRPDIDRLKVLKKRRLRFREEIARLEAHLIYRPSLTTH